MSRRRRLAVRCQEGEPRRRPAWRQRSDLGARHHRHRRRAASQQSSSRSPQCALCAAHPDRARGQGFRRAGQRLSPGAIKLRPRLVLAAAATGSWPLLSAVSLLGWAALIGSSHSFAISSYCGAAAGQWDLGVRQVSQSLPQFNATGGLFPHWMLMLLAMMSPLLAEPLTYVWRRSLARRRLRGLTAFLIAYLGVWLLAGIPLSLVAIGFRELAELRQGWVPPAAIAVALLWQLTPAKQTCLNRCHRLPRLSAFGGAADRGQARS